MEGIRFFPDYFYSTILYSGKPFDGPWFYPVHPVNPVKVFLIISKGITLTRPLPIVERERGF